MSESHNSPERAAGPRQPAGAAPEKGQRERAHWEKLQQQLDEALAATFPASDPVSIVTSQEEDWGDP